MLIAWISSAFAFLIKVSVWSFNFKQCNKGVFCGRGWFGTGYSSLDLPLLPLLLPWISAPLFWLLTAPSLLFLKPYTFSTSFQPFCFFTMTLMAVGAAASRWETGRVNEHRGRLYSVCFPNAPHSPCLSVSFCVHVCLPYIKYMHTSAIFIEQLLSEFKLGGSWLFLMPTGKWWFPLHPTPTLC